MGDAPVLTPGVYGGDASVRGRSARTLPESRSVRPRLLTISRRGRTTRPPAHGHGAGLQGQSVARWDRVNSRPCAAIRGNSVLITQIRRQPLPVNTVAIQSSQSA